jgi:hypothetical protein
MRTKFGAASVGYLLQAQQMEDILQSEEEPDYENMPNGATQSEQYDLKQRNDRLRKDFEYRRGVREKKYSKMQHDVEKAISIIIDMCHEPIAKQIHVLRSTTTYQERNIEDQFAHLITYLRDKYGPDGENTVSKWEKMLEAMDPNTEEGMNHVISTFTTCVAQMEQVTRVDATGAPVNEGPRHERSYCPTEERLRRFLITALKKANHSEYIHYAAQLDMQEPPNLDDSATIITRLEKYVSKEYDTITKQDDSSIDVPLMGQHTQYDMTGQNTRQLYSHDGRSINQQQGQYTRASHGSTEFTMYEDDYEDPIQYTQEQDTRVSLAATRADKGRGICTNCYTTGHYVKDCESLRCNLCNNNFKTFQERRQHYFDTHYKDRRSLNMDNTMDQNKVPRKSRFSDRDDTTQYRAPPADAQLKYPRTNDSTSNTSRDARWSWTGQPTKGYTLQSSASVDNNRNTAAEDDQPPPN